MGLAFDEWDLDYYTSMFRDELKRDPTNVELFDIAQSNSEHSRCVGGLGGVCRVCGAGSNMRVCVGGWGVVVCIFLRCVQLLPSASPICQMRHQQAGAAESTHFIAHTELRSTRFGC